MMTCTYQNLNGIMVIPDMNLVENY